MKISTTQLDEKDWIILRLLMSMAKQRQATMNPVFNRCVFWMSKTMHGGVVAAATKALRDEEDERNAAANAAEDRRIEALIQANRVRTNHERYSHAPKFLEFTLG